MPVDRITAAQFRTLLRNAVDNRAKVYDTGVGAIPTVAMHPLASVLEDQNDTVRDVSLVISLSNELAFTDEYSQDLDDYVFNEGLVRILGGRAVGEVTFSTTTEPQADIVIQRGFPIGTVSDESTGQTFTFVTTEERTLPYATRQSFFNPDTTPGQWELPGVPVIAVATGTGSRIGPNRLTRFLRTALGFRDVTNPEATTGGRGLETNAELIQRFLIAIRGRRLSTVTGIQKFILDLFPDVTDVAVVYGNDPLLTRAASDAGAVDTYILGDQTLDEADSIEYLGVGQLLQVSTPPLVSITGVTSGGITYTEYDATAGTGDFTVVFDTTGNAGSTRAVEGIQFPAAGVAKPTVGDSVRVSYSYDSLVRNIQLRSDEDDALVLGRDQLIKRRTDVPIAITATLTTETGFGFATVEPLVRSNILTFVNTTLKLNDDVERSDVNADARTITGVDNLVFTRFSLASQSSGVGDITIERNENATLSTADLVINS